MTKKQQLAIIKVIEKDATISGHNIGTKPGESCVIGGLGLAAGIEREILMDTNDGPVSELPDAALATLFKKWGLSGSQLEALQDINDSHSVQYWMLDQKDKDELTKERRKALIKKVKSWKPTDTK